MSSNLIGSIVRGFGFTLGRSAATSLLDGLSKESYDTYTPPSPYKTGGVQKLFILLGWLWSFIYTINRYTTYPKDSSEYDFWVGMGLFCMFLGWLPIWLFFRIYNYITISSKIKKLENEEMVLNEKKKNDLRPLISQMLNDLKLYPFINLNLTSSGGNYNWEENQHTATLEQMERIYTPLSSVTKTLKQYKEKGYDDDTICNIYNEELWLGMTEEHMRDMKGEPTKTEKESLSDGSIRTKHIYGNRTSGDVLVFENGKLVSFKDR